MLHHLSRQLTAPTIQAVTTLTKASSQSTALFSTASNHVPHSPSTRLSLAERCATNVAAIETAGTFKHERVIESPMGPTLLVNGKRVLNFCANNYLGLSNHPAILQAATETLATRGFGLSSVRFICGTQDIHKQLERVISKFHGTEDTILYPSCFDANAGLFEAVLGKEDAILTDELNHASIIDGIRLCKAERHRYKHLDVNDLEAKLQATQHCRTRLIATDGVFSMDGDVAPLFAIRALADKYNASLFVDDCHATGFFGPTGRGSDEYCGIYGNVELINSTLGKGLGGGTGGYTTGKASIIALLRQKSRPYLFSNSVSPVVVGASLAVFDLLMQDSCTFVDTIRTSTHLFRDRMTAAGFTLTGERDHPIVSVMIYDARHAAALADALLDAGIYVIGFSFPVVPEGQARIRVQLSSSHTLDMVNTAVDAFITCGKAQGVI